MLLNVRNALHDVLCHLEFILYLQTLAFYMQMTHYTSEKEYINLINFIPYLNLMKCHLPFNLHTSCNKTTNIIKR